MVGVRYRRALFPGFSDQAEFAFDCPGTMAGRVTKPFETEQEFGVDVPGEVRELTVSAKLMYRKFDQFLLNFLFGEEAGLTAPVTVMSEDAATISVEPDVTD